MPEMKPEHSQAVPFFARFLESQNVEDVSDEAAEAISGGKNDGITKPKKDDVVFETLKFPSDAEDTPA